MRCKKCGSSDYVKSGYVRNNQRYKCKSCGCNFIIGDSRGKISPQAKALGVLMYGSGKASYGMIARLFKVSRSTVLYWIRTMGSKLPEPDMRFFKIFFCLSLIEHSRILKISRNTVRSELKKNASR
jgi:transposase-like protein